MCIFGIFLKLSSGFLGEHEPVSNTIYNFISNNNKSPDNSFYFLDYFNLIFFLIPNTLLVLHTHFEGTLPNFILQNSCVLNLFGFYIYGNLNLLIVGLLNILLTISLIAADEETYHNFGVWFDAIGIVPYSY
jgi:hypothetical protein